MSIVNEFSRRLVFFFFFNYNNCVVKTTERTDSHSSVAGRTILLWDGNEGSGLYKIKEMDLRLP